MSEEVEPYPEEILNLLFYDNPPVSLAEGEFKKKIGKEKYQAYLNFLYGVLVEEMLILSKMEEIRKRRRSLGLLKDSTVQDEAYRNLYNGTKIELMKRFQKEKGYPQQITVSIDKLREFTYWLFKLRIRISDKSRVASDTKQALLLLNRFMSMKNHTSIRSI